MSCAICIINTEKSLCPRLKRGKNIKIIVAVPYLICVMYVMLDLFGLAFATMFYSTSLTKFVY